MSYPSTFLRWIQRKHYQYEVTFSLYMLTPTEKFIFNSLLFLFLSMILIAASLYLPEHITTVLSRAWFYYAGDDSTATTAGAGAGAGAGSPSVASGAGRGGEGGLGGSGMGMSGGGSGSGMGMGKVGGEL